MSRDRDLSRDELRRALADLHDRAYLAEQEAARYRAMAVALGREVRSIKQACDALADVNRDLVLALMGAPTQQQRACVAAAMRRH